MKSKMILQIHDELIFDMDPEEENDLRTIVEQSMSQACKLEVPLVVDIGVGDNWLEAH
jgi:DNA polymerase-1